jgi:hypothetical protein
MNNTQNILNWKKGDIIALTNYDGEVISVFEAKYDPQYCRTMFGSEEDWYYSLRNCKEIRLATVEDIDCKIKIQKEEIKRKQADLDQLLNFRERLSK